MKNFFTIILCLFSPLVSGQNYERAIVTDLNFIRRTSSVVYAENFPFYFQHKEFAMDIQTDIRNYIIEKFKVQEVLFMNRDSIYYLESSFAPRTEAKDFAEATNRPNTIFIAIETLLQEQGYIKGELIYRFTTRVNVFNNKGKNIYKFKNNIPFVSVFGDEIAGYLDMGENDFYAFYFDGLQYAFEGVNKTVEKRYITKPTAEKYLEFINNSEKYYLITEKDGYSFGKDYDHISEGVHFTINSGFSSNNIFNFANLVTLDFLENGYSFINRLDKTEYKVRLKGGLKTLKEMSDPLSDISLQLLTFKNEHVGYFTYEKNNLLYGKYYGQEIKLVWEADYSCLEVYINDLPVAMINYYTGQKVLYLTKAITQKQIVSILNMMFIYDYSLAIRERMYAEY
jgi:hypothetical protein